MNAAAELAGTGIHAGFGFDPHSIGQLAALHQDSTT